MVRKRDWRKVIDALNDYERTQRYVVLWEEDEPLVRIAQVDIVSRSYGFIEWLVKNERIDWDKFCDMETETEHYFDAGYTLLYSSPMKDYVNVLLMELAINKEPIRFLAEVIK